MTATKPTQEYTNELVTIGRIRRPTGISGAVLADVYSGNADRFHVGDVVTVGERTLTIIDTGRSGNSAKLTFKSIDSIEKADQLRNHEISVFSDELPKRIAAMKLKGMAEEEIAKMEAELDRRIKEEEAANDSGGD